MSKRNTRPAFLPKAHQHFTSTPPLLTSTSPTGYLMSMNWSTSTARLFPQALQFASCRLHEFFDQPGFCVSANSEIGDELQLLLSKWAHGDPVACAPPCSGPRQECQSTMLQNQRNSLLCARDVMQLRGSDFRLCRRVPDRVIHVRTHLLCEQGPDAIVQVRKPQFATGSQRIAPRHDNVKGMLRQFEKCERRRIRNASGDREIERSGDDFVGKLVGVTA